MSVFKELERQYNDIDNQYAALEFDARSRRWVRKEADYRRKREINDQAYFLFMFTRLEDRINDLSGSLITRKQHARASWKQKAAWDILPTGSNSKIYFKNRLALLTDKTGSDYALVVKYYKERNAIAHGGSFINPISMPSVIADFKRLYEDLNY